jgi:fluoroquinolone resistance protein
MTELDRDSYDGETIEGLNLSNGSIPGKEFYRCRFKGCNLTEADLSGCVFEECGFFECNLSNPLIKGSRLIGAEFSECKIVGLNFYHCDQLVFDCGFSKSALRNCNFSELKMKGAKFLGCRIDECDFDGAFLVGAAFDDSVFRLTSFHNCNLEKASFLEAKGYEIDPRTARVKQAVFSVPDVLSLIECFGIVIKNRD